MEDVAVSAERRHIQHADDQHTDVQNTTINEELDESCPSDTSWKFESLGSSWQCHQTAPDPSCSQGSAVSALQSKVKALKQGRALWKQPSKSNPHEKPVSRSHMLGRPAAEAYESSSSDDGVKPYNRAHTLQAACREPWVSNEGEFDPVAVAALLALPRGLGEGSSSESLAANKCNDKPDVSFTASSKSPWVPPKDFWKVCRPDTLQLREDAAPDLLRTGADEGRGVHTKSMESDHHSCRKSEDGTALTMAYGLSHAERVGSMGTGGSTISLAERVEMNRCALRQVLQKAQSKSCEGNRAMGHRLEKTHVRAELNDSEADSGISLQDTEHTPRAFVGADESPLLLLSPRHEQAKRLLERARMKARCCPLRADHSLLPVHRDQPELLSWVRVPAQQRLLVGKEGGASGPGGVTSGNLSDSSSSDSAGASRRRRGQSPTRVRFEDESEKEAEVRYLERLRQRRRAGERAHGLLAPKPSLTCYTNGRAELPQRSRNSPIGKHDVEDKRMDLLNTSGLQQSEREGRLCGSCGTLLDGTLTKSNALTQPSLNGETQLKTMPCWVAPTLPNRMVRIEQIKETYIGAVAPVAGYTGDAGAGEGADGSGRVTFQKQKKRTRRVDGGEVTSNGCEMPNSLPTAGPAPSGTDLQTASTAVLPPNPYQPEPKSLTPPPKSHSGETQSFNLAQHVLLPLQPRKSALKFCSLERLGSRHTATPAPPSPCHSAPLDPAEESVAPPADLQHSEIRQSPEPSSRNSDLMQVVTSSNQNSHANERPALTTHPPAGLEQNPNTAAPPATRLYGEQSDGHVQGAIRAEQGQDRTNRTQHTASGLDQRPVTVLRRFFSAMGLNGGGDSGRLGISRSGSVEQLSSHNPGTTSGSCTGTGRLKKAPSLQSLRLCVLPLGFYDMSHQQGSPLLHLKKSSSVQNLKSPSRRQNRSSAYTPAAEHNYSPATPRALQRTLSVEDVSSPSAVRSVGRVVQLFPDGTLQLELNRPPDGPFGFLISRGKGRPDSGVYVEEMRDSSMGKLYAGLLGVGDEIVEVNGEKVAGLSLELVTRLMSRSSTASIRVLRQRRLQR